MPTIFISYAHEDKARAKAIHDRLETAGWDCWIACDDITSGGGWAKSIGTAIRQSKALLLVFSRSSNASEEVEREVLLARHFKCPVIPFVIEEFDLAPEFEYHLISIQRLPAYEMSEDEALTMLQKHISRYASPPQKRITSQTRALRGEIVLWRETGWERLLLMIDEGEVIPIIGPELLAVTVGGQQTLLYSYLAQRVAEHFHIPMQKLASADVLAELAYRWIEHDNDMIDLRRELARALPPPGQLQPPEPLQQLARIDPLKLFITTTFDPLMELALNQERFGGASETRVLCHSPNGSADFSELQSSQRPAVFHIFDRLSGMESYPITEYEMFAMIRSIDSDGPSNLLRELRHREILLLGTNLTDCIARFFLPLICDARRPITIVDSHLNPGSGFRDYVIGSNMRMQIYLGGAVEFVNELFHRWSERHSPPEPLVPGSIFISFASEDRASAERLAQALRSAGLDVWHDASLKKDDFPDGVLRQYISHCSVFIPVLSRRVESTHYRWFRREWAYALEIAKGMAPSVRFIMPVVVDDLSPQSDAVPPEFGELQWMRMDSGAGVDAIVEAARAECRNYRRALMTR